jgi:hypothetical protein
MICALFGTTCKPSQARALVDAVNRAGAPADASAFLREALGRV